MSNLKAKQPRARRVQLCSSRRATSSETRQAGSRDGGSAARVSVRGRGGAARRHARLVMSGVTDPVLESQRCRRKEEAHTGHWPPVHFCGQDSRDHVFISRHFISPLFTFSFKMSLTRTDDWNPASPSFPLCSLWCAPARANKYLPPVCCLNDVTHFPCMQHFHFILHTHNVFLFSSYRCHQRRYLIHS